MASPAACSRRSAERPLDRGAVAPGAGGLQAADLLALERRVDAQDLERLLALLLEGVDADDDPPPLVHLALVGERGIGDLALREVAA